MKEQKTHVMFENKLNLLCKQIIVDILVFTYQ